jgi:hypothetical protein
MPTAETANTNNTAPSRKVRRMLGLDLHSWEQLMLLSLGLAGLIALAVFITTASVVILTRHESAETKREYATYKLTVDGKVADAKSEGIKAGRDAGNALLRAAELEKQAEQLRKDTAEANARAAEAKLELERFKQPRTLTIEQQDRISSKLRPFAGQEFILSVAPHPESFDFLLILESIVTKAGWVRGKPVTPVNAYSGKADLNFEYGVLIQMAPSQVQRLTPAVGALVYALKDEGALSKDEARIVPELENKTTAIQITVGFKPL